MKIKSQWDSSVCVQEMKLQFPGGKLENLKTQKLKIKMPLRHVEIPSKHNVHKKHLLIYSSPHTILLNSEEKRSNMQIGTNEFRQENEKLYIHMIPPPFIYV